MVQNLGFQRLQLLKGWSQLDLEIRIELYCTRERNHFYNTMREVQPGDLVLSFRSTRCVRRSTSAPCATRCPSAPPAPMPERVADRPEAADTLKRTWEDHLEKRIITDPHLESTERSALVNARRGQGRFRENVLAIEKACRVTRVDNPEHLVASHCKPWRHADNGERLDGENGLMLTPSIDHLFDRGFITFENNGRVIVSPVADGNSLRRMGVDPAATILVGSFSSGQKTYLDYHRNEIFLSAG